MIGRNEDSVGGDCVRRSVRRSDTTYKLVQCALQVEAVDERLNVVLAFSAVILLAHLNTLAFQQLLRSLPL